MSAGCEIVVARSVMFRVRIVSLGALAAMAVVMTVAIGRAGEVAQLRSVPGDPVVVAAPGGAFAVAVPALARGPALAGDSVAFAVEDEARERLFWIRAAGAAGTWRTLYVPPRKRPGSAFSLVASNARVVALRHHPDRIQTCSGDECSPSPDEVVEGPVGGPMARVFGATERLEPRGSCRRRIAQLVGDDISVSGDRIAYARRVRCLRPRRGGRSQLVVRDLRTGALRVVRRGGTRGVQLAGRYLAFEPYRARGQAPPPPPRDDQRRRIDDGPVVVTDLRTGRIAYRAQVGSHFALGADGTLVQTILPRRCCPLIGRLGWRSPRSPRLHRLPNRVAVFSSRPLAYAAGRIAYVSRYDDDVATLSVSDLNGRSRDHASFHAPERLEAFAFDGSRLAFASTRYRPDQGEPDDRLRSICVGDRILVQAAASVIEVHPITDPGRIPAPSRPLAQPYRSPAAERPECPYRD
jgi:hypothetical protein